jgi:septin family protein
VLPVEILPVQETIVLRARGSELLILPHHVKKLKDMTKPRDFSQYFRAEALVNRPARKLFEAWLRKDHTLWPRLYQTVHKEMDDVSGEDEKPTPKKAEKKEEKAEVKAKEEKAAPKKAEKKEEKAAPKKAEKKEEKAAAPKAKAKEKAEKKPAKAEKPKAKATAGKKKG